MRQRYVVLLGTLLALLFPALQASATLSDYGFSVQKGSFYEINGTDLLNPDDDDVASSAADIGFTFFFDGLPYNQFTVSSNGLIGLGGSKVSSCWVNQLRTGSGLCAGIGGYDYTASITPQLAAYWDDLRVPSDFDDGFDGKVSYETIGEAPHRILVIEYRDIETWYISYEAYSTWQIRLYETSNRIEYYYEYMNPTYFHDGGTIGVSVDPANFISVTPQPGGSATISTTTANDRFNMNSVPIPQGTMYVFSPCQLLISGDVLEGGTEAMQNNDSLLLGKVVNVGGSGTFYPIDIDMDGGCGSRPFNIAIGGPAASEYQVSPATGNIPGGTRVTPTITFSPTGSGKRLAQITITDAKGRSLSYYLAAEGASRIKWSGDVNEGGTPEMKNGDSLMTTIHVSRGESGTFTPFTVTNVGENSELPPAKITYSIKGISGGQYSIDPTDAEISAGESSSPTITFTPTGVGPIRDSLFVNADGEIRAFPLLAVSDAAGANFYLNGDLVTNNTTAFINRFGCAGSEPISVPLVVENVGNEVFTIDQIDFFLTDTAYGQGVPRYPLLRDGQENPIHSYDYIITEGAPVPPYTMAQQTLPIMIPIGETRTLYFTFIGQQPGKRFARAFIHTNGETVSNLDPNGEQIEGLVTLDLFGRGLGASFSDNPNGGLPKPVNFPITRVGEPSDVQMYLFNPGTCELRISIPFMEITGGDADEFSITRKPSTRVDPATGDLLLAPGATDTLWLRFVPRQIGSRRASIRMMTNDSTIQIPGVTERGTYYLDLYGQGKADIYAEDVDFGQALIGGTSTDMVRRIVRLNNTLNGPIIITKVIFEDGDAGEFTQDGTTWPGFPVILNGGQQIDLSVLFGPVAGGQPGPRTTMLKFITSAGDTIKSRLTGVAATRTATVTPTTANFGPITIGKMIRKTISIMNSGTMPLTLGSPTLSPGSDFSIGTLPRTVLAPGQTEYLEVTYTPQTAGGSTATLEIPSNATNGPLQVTLNGTAQKTKLVIDDPSQSATRGNAGGGLSQRDELNVSGVTGEEIAGGMALFQSVPNPARDQVEIGYRVAARGNVQIALYDASGRLVRVLMSGMRDAGEGSIRVDVSDLASGVYHYRLIANSKSLSRTLNIVR